MMTGARLLFVIAMAIATMCVALIFATNDAHDVVRWTARTSLVLFALAYVARPATVLWPSPLTKRLLRERKWLGDGFAVSHLAHLAGIIAIAVEDWDAFIASRATSTLLAVAAYFVLFAMAITSIDRVRKAMSKRAWDVLHRTGMHLFWVVFIGSYARRLDAPISVIASALLVAIAAIRVAAWLRARSRARARASVAA
jgi:hypothetical protein